MQIRRRVVATVATYRVRLLVATRALLALALLSLCLAANALYGGGGDAGGAAASIRSKFYSPSTDLFSLMVAVTALAIGSTFIHNDLRVGRLATLLGHGVRREEYLTGVWVAGAGICAGLEMARALACGMALLVVGEVPDGGLFLGALALALGSAVILSLVALAAVIVRRPMLAILMTLGVLSLGPLAFSTGLPPALATVLRIIAFPLPWLGLQREVVTNTLLAQHVSLLPALEVVVYRSLWIVALLALANRVFRGRELLMPSS